MNTLKLQRDFFGEHEEIWQTKTDEIAEALKELNIELIENGWLYLCDENDKIIASKKLNEGF